MFISTMDTLNDIEAKTITADALLTQRTLATYLVKTRKAHYMFIAKDNQPTIAKKIKELFSKRGTADFVTEEKSHGRFEKRSIWVSTKLNNSLNFPYVGQVFAIERETIDNKSGKRSIEVSYGLTSHQPFSADAKRLLRFNRDHWQVESLHYILDHNWNEDHCRIRKGHGPENITAFRRFAIGVIRMMGKREIAGTIAKLNRDVRRVFDYLRMTDNSIGNSKFN